MTREFINWGILAPGKIAGKFVRELNRIPDARLIAVGSRNVRRAEEFKRRHGAQYAFGSYEELAACPEVDIIYVASPHSLHLKHTLLCLHYGKHVLCEKPMGINYSQVKQMTEAAHSSDCFLMEGMWTRFLPAMKKTVELAENGAIGDVVMLEADFGFRATYHPESRIYNPLLGGGALLDIGIYPVFLALILFGMPEDMSAHSILADTGVDAQTTLQMKWQTSRLAQLHCSFLADTEVTARVYGTDGYLYLPPRWHEAKTVHLCNKRGIVQSFHFEDENPGYRYEIEEIHRCLRRGARESSLLPWSFSLSMIRLMDEVRKQTGVIYPMDREV